MGMMKLGEGGREGKNLGREGREINQSISQSMNPSIINIKSSNLLVSVT